MGTLIRLKNTKFNNSNLPVVQLPYTGLRDGLVGAFHLRKSLELCHNLLTGEKVQAIGSPTIEDQYVRGGGGLNGLDLGIPHNDATVFTMCGIHRHTGTSSGYGFGLNTFASVDSYGTNSGANFMGNLANPARAQMHAYTSDRSDTSAMLGLDQYYPNAETGVWYAYIMVVDSDAGTTTVYYPTEGVKSVRDMQGHLAAHGGVNWLVGCANDQGIGVFDSAYAAVFSKALSDEEVEYQYASMLAYANNIGIQLGS